MINTELINIVVALAAILGFLSAFYAVKNFFINKTKGKDDK